MTLRSLVAALGGDLYAGGSRASVPAPGHSAADRSVSLLLSEGRVIIHGFGGADWREVRADLRARGLIDADGRPAGVSGGNAPLRPDRGQRLAAARDLWRSAGPLDGATPADRYLARRAVATPAHGGALRYLARAPVSVFRPGRRHRPALVARVDDLQGRLTAVELTYLHANGLRATDLRVSRKTVGLLPAGAAVRLGPAAADMLVAEGVITALSAIERFGQPGWALLSASNLSAWSPPACARSVLIAADSGRVGETSAERLRRSLVAAGRTARVVRPDPPHGDWNDVAAAARRRGEEGL